MLGWVADLSLLQLLELGLLPQNSNNNEFIFEFMGFFFISFTCLFAYLFLETGSYGTRANLEFVM